MSTAHGARRPAHGSTSLSNRALGFGLCALCLFATACGPRRIVLPTDPGIPFPEYASVAAQITAACTGVRTLTVELGLSGSAAGEGVSGRVIAGFERPDAMRLEGVAPFGAPAFILAARGNEAILLLPRDDRVVRGAPAGEILGALTGVSLSPADLLAILTGCVTPDPRATGGRLHPEDWASIDLADGAVLYLRRAGAGWVLRAAQRDGWQLEYPDWRGTFPASVRLQSDGEAADVDLTATLAQVETNVDLPAAAFTVNVPASARPLSVEALRQTGPLRGQ